MLSNGPEEAAALLLAHGAGAPMDTDFMNAFAKGIAGCGLRVVRFEFNYMAGRRTGGSRRPPPAADALQSEFLAALDTLDGGTRFIGGKSLGGRVATMIAETLYDQGRIDGVVCLGYPFHPPGKPESLRTAHLKTLTCPTLIVQGEKDPFGTRQQCAGYDLPDTIGFHWVPFGNHNLEVPKKSGREIGTVWHEAALAIARFMQAAKA